MTTDQYFLSHGSHRTAADGRCAMEFVAYLAGEPHSDRPACVSSVLRDFGVVFNDALDDDLRQRLRPYLARMIGTAGDGHDKERGWLCVDWLVRVYVPAWFELAGLTVLAARLRALPAVTSRKAFQHAEPVLTEARSEASTGWTVGRVAVDETDGVAAGGVAGDAARVAAGDAAGAVRVAMWGTVGVTWPATGGVAWVAAAGVAARAAAEGPAWMAGGLAGAALRPTVAELQRSAFDLLDRMLPTEPLALPALETANPAPVPVGTR